MQHTFTNEWEAVEFIKGQKNREWRMFASNFDVYFGITKAELIYTTMQICGGTWKEKELVITDSEILPRVAYVDMIKRMD
jgi:hypothetical protein